MMSANWGFNKNCEIAYIQGDLYLVDLGSEEAVPKYSNEKKKI